MKNSNERKVIYGYLVAGIGFILILLTGLNYLFHWKWIVPHAAIGIVFLGAGMALVRRSRKQQD